MSCSGLDTAPQWASLLLLKALSGHAAVQTPAGFATEGKDVQNQACPEAAHLFDNLPLAISAQARGD